MAEITHIQNGEEGGSVREKLNRTIDHTKDRNNPHRVRADQVPVSPPIPDIDGQQTVQSVLEWLAQYGGQAAGAGLIISPTPPKNVPTGTQWLDSVNAVVYIWDEDKWLEFPAGHGADVEIADLPPADPDVGDMWTDYGTTGELYIWDGRFWVSMTGDGGPKVIIGGGEENPDIELPENLVFDRVENLDDYDKALARFIAPDNTGKWGRIKTGDVLTDPSATFRDSKGRFKSTKEYEVLTDQLKVNRFLANKLEDQGEAIEGQGGLLEETNAGLVRIDNQVAENTSNIIQLQDSVENIDIPEVDLSDYINRAGDSMDGGKLFGTDRIGPSGGNIVQYEPKAESGHPAALVNQAMLWEALKELPVIVDSDPPEIEKDGQLWYDDDRLELFVSFQGGWISTTPLESRIEAGEIIQQEILGRLDVGEAKQRDIDANAMTKGGPQTLTDEHWSVKTDDGKTYMMISDDEITMYHVAKPEAPKQPTNKEYVDNADKKMQTDISNLEAKVIELEGAVGEHRFIYNNEQNNPRDGNFVCKDARYEITDSTDDARYLEFGSKDVNGVPVDYSKIKAGDVLRLVGPAGERVEFSLEEVAESGTFLINGATITGLDTFVNGIQYATTILSAFDPSGLASIEYVDRQDAKKLDLRGGTGSKMQGNLYMGGYFIAGVGEPTSNDHAATKSYADGKLANTGGTMTGTLTMQRQDDVSYWNYIDFKTPKAWVGGSSEEAKATQKTHGVIIKIGDTNSYKQQFKIQGRSNKDLFKIYDDGTGNFSFYGNVGVTGYLKQDGKPVATEEYVDSKIPEQSGDISPYRHKHYFRVEERDSITNGQVHWSAMGSGWLRFMIGTKTNGDFRYDIPNFDTKKISMPFSIFYIEEGDLTETKFVLSAMTDSVRCYTSGETQALYIEVDPDQIICWQPNSVEDMKQVIVKIGSLTP